jgi:hypothetical protein
VAAIALEVAFFAAAAVYLVIAVASIIARAWGGTVFPTVFNDDLANIARIRWSCYSGSLGECAVLVIGSSYVEQVPEGGSDDGDICGSSSLFAAVLRRFHTFC